MAAFDKLRDKWQAISPREQRMVVLLGVSTVLVLIIYVSLQIQDGLNRLEAKNAKARKALATLTAYKAQARAVTADDPAKLIGAEAVKLETYIFEAAGKANVTVPGVNGRGPSPKGAFIAHAATVEVRELSIAQIKDFLEAIESGNKIVQVSSLQIRRNFRDKEKLDLNIEVVTWSKAAAEGGDDKDSGAGASTGTAKGGG
jgi:type II secretory pathway component PulM